MKNKRHFHRLWLVGIIFVTAFIFSHSLMSGEKSSAESETVQRWMLALFGNGFANSFLYIYIRKIAHFTEFGALGFLWTAWYCSLEPKQKTARLFWLSGPLTATADELLQFFSDGRAPMLKDVLLDCAGYFTGLLLVFVSVIVWRKCSRKKDKTL